MAELILSGPWFDDADGIIGELAENCIHAVSGQAKDDWSSNLHDNLQHPTGKYESRVHVDESPDRDVLNDDQSVYGPWLEGTGSRNAPRTRFEGYQSFQDMVDALPGKISDVCQPHVDEAVGELNA
ncbi:MAG TPA: hypothetical protein VHX38_18930 [Pseudonocardiaceae bacterium]|jgi:hypothetical protein|nr:hypothetical protein [Pseudonocardiaceae bacterium]